VGCSTGGEIMGTFVDDESLVMTAIDFEDTDITLATASLNDFPDSFDAGEQLGKQLRGKDLSAVFVLSDGLLVNATDVIRGIIAQVGTQIPITGGLAGDGERFEKTYVGADAPATEKTLVAIGFYGDAIHVGHGSVGGWDTFGPERLITRSEGNVLYEFDGKPALELYKRYLGEEAE